MIKRKMITALFVLAILLFPARAATFSDEQFTLTIPEEGRVYYYSAQGSNMTGTMLENAQKQDMLLLVGAYSESGTLRYTFKAERKESTDAKALAEELQNSLAAAYSLYLPAEEQLNGWSGWSLQGQSVQNSNYLVKIFVLGEAPSLVLTTMYQHTAEPELQVLLENIQWPGQPSKDPAMELEPGAIPLPGSETDPEVPEDPGSGVEQEVNLLPPQPLEPIQEEESGQKNVLERLTAFLKGDITYLLLALSGALAGIVVLLLLQRLRKSRAKGYEPKHAKR